MKKGVALPSMGDHSIRIQGNPFPVTVRTTGGNKHAKNESPRGPDTLGNEIFNQTGISGTSVSVPKTLFKPGVKYGIYIFSIMADIKFSGMVDNASAFKLRQSVASYFSMKPLK